MIETMYEKRCVKMVMDKCLIRIPWETRNLGLQSFEVSEDFVQGPDEQTLKDVLKTKIEEHGRIFVQARVSKGNSHVIPLLERNNFNFIETILVPYTTLQTNPVLNRFIADKSEFLPKQYNCNDCRVVQINKDDISSCLRIKEIGTESFSDDRFHIDHQCSNEIADIRFSFWIEDMLADEQVIFHTVNYLGRAQGFMTRKSDNLILAGFSKEFIGKGLAKFLWLSVLEDVANEGFSQVHTLISTNNTPVLNLYTRLGFKFKDPAVTLHYWSNG